MSLKSTLKVALVTPYPVDVRRIPGGVRSVAYYLAQGLRCFQDLDIHVLHCHSEVPENRVEVEDNLAVHYMAMPKRRVVPNTMVAVERVARELRRLRPDVVNAHAPHYAVAALRSGYPTIYTIHGVIHREAQVYRSRLFDRFRLGLEMWYDRYAVRRVSDIVAISPYVLKEYRDLSQARFHRIDNPLPPDFFAVPDLEEEGRLLYVGTIDERKNPLDLMRALVIVRQHVPNVQLRIAGRTTNPYYYQQVQEFIAAHGLEANVKFLGLQDREHLLQEYACCAVVVLSSRQETQPMAVLEAMAAGKPVVATRVGGVPDLIEGGNSGFTVAVGDVEALAQRILDLLNDRSLRKALGQCGQQFAQRFRLETIAAQYRGLYYQVARRTMP
ncbi:MAG: glycosyltransferase family 4 protein [Chloroflexi bacterium]|nr:glycosyltransferase family 4 protein [Chloroflexota bacterium]